MAESGQEIIPAHDVYCGVNICWNYHDMEIGKKHKTVRPEAGKRIKYVFLCILAGFLLGGTTGCGSPTSESAGQSGDLSREEEVVPETGTEGKLPDAGMDTRSDGAGTDDKEDADNTESQASLWGEEEDFNLTFRLAGGDNASGFPEEIQEQIGRINAGEALDAVLGLEELEAYSALIGTHIIVAEEKESGREGTGRGRLTMYVPNLLKSLEDVSVLFYDSADGMWKIIPLEKMDTEAKTVTAVLTGSGIITVIYKRQG